MGKFPTEHISRKKAGETGWGGEGEKEIMADITSNWHSCHFLSHLPMERGPRPRLAQPTPNGIGTL